MRTSEQINELAGALAKAQGKMENASLNKVNPHFKSKYADLAGIRDAVTPALAANGIAVVQALDTDEGGLTVVTRLVHTSGQWMESVCPIDAGGTMQAKGSAITYARRYSLSAICCIAADEDDDANAATEHRKSFDEAGYQKWIEGLRTTIREVGYAAMVDDVKVGPREFQDALRADKKTWAALKATAGVLVS